MGGRKTRKSDAPTTGAPTIVIHPPKVAPESFTAQPDAEHKRHKDKIPKAVREQLWVRDIGEKFYGKCKTSWCTNRVTVFDFQCGHNIPESKGGPTTLENMVVLCSRCNNSMSNNYTFDEWESKYHPRKLGWRRYFSCF